MYNTEFLNLLKQKITLSDVIGQRVKLIHKGRSKVACCPFHNEKTPSFHVNDEKGIYHCFGCNAHGDAISFVMQFYGLSFKEAIERLAEEYGVELPKLDKHTLIKQQQIADATNVLYDINEKTCQFFQNCIFSGGGRNGLNYILKRGLNVENIKKFRIGFAPIGFDNLINHLKKLDFTEEQMEKAGVVAINEKKKYYDKFRNRVMFPVFDKKGRVIAFSGRVVVKDDMPKYMNSPETLIYHKGDVLFNYFFAKKGIYDSKNAILVEGNLDAISLYINNVENVVAPMGTAITLKQIEELWNITDEIIVCLDGDTAGQKASKRLIMLVLPILSAIKNMKIVLLPDGQDPDSLIKSLGKNKFLDFINSKDNCLSLSEFLWKSELADSNINSSNNYITPEEKSKLEVKLEGIVKQISNQMVARNFKDFYRKQLFLITKFDGGKKINIYRDTTKINFKQVTHPVHSMENLKENIIMVENRIFSLLLNRPQLIEEIFQKYNVDILNIDYYNSGLAKLIDILLHIYELNLLNDKEYLHNILEKNDFSNYTISSRSYDDILDEKKIKYLYFLILERNAMVLEIEIKELGVKNDNQKKRNCLYNELEILQKKKDDLGIEF
jgi:DNA primase